MRVERDDGCLPRSHRANPDECKPITVRISLVGVLCKLCLLSSKGTPNRFYSLPVVNVPWPSSQEQLLWIHEGTYRERTRKINWAMIYRKICSVSKPYHPPLIMWANKFPIVLFHLGFSVAACYRVCDPMISHVRLFVTPWTIAHQAPLSLGVFSQECKQLIFQLQQN